jgi:hypothetical protein
MGYSRHTIPVGDRRDVGNILEAISRLPNLVVVNLVSPIHSKPVCFCTENLRAMLTDAPGSLLVETLPGAEYKRVVTDAIDQTAQVAAGLRAALRSQPVAGLTGEVADFLLRLDPLLLLLDGFVLQRADLRLGPSMLKLRDLRGQVAASWFEHEDNVRCMDDLQYEILPSLRSIRKAFS